MQSYRHSGERPATYRIHQDEKDVQVCINNSLSSEIAVSSFFPISSNTPIATRYARSQQGHVLSQATYYKLYISNKSHLFSEIYPRVLYIHPYVMQVKPATLKKKAYELAGLRYVFKNKKNEIINATLSWSDLGEYADAFKDFFECIYAKEAGKYSDKLQSEMQYFLYHSISQRTQCFYLVKGNDIFERNSPYFREGTDPYNLGMNHISVGGIKTVDPKKITHGSMVKHEESMLKKELDDRILHHKSSAVEYIIAAYYKSNTMQEHPAIFLNPAQTETKFPAVVIQLKRIPSDVDITGYSKLCTHVLIACINNALYDNNIGVYVERRQSFGFLMPTATDVHGAIRLSLGLIPSASWMMCVIQGIHQFHGHVLSIKTSCLYLSQLCDVFKGDIFGKSEFDDYGHQWILNQLKSSRLPIFTILDTMVVEKDAIQASVQQGGLNEFSDRMNKKSFISFQESCALFKALYEDINAVYDDLLKKYDEDVENHPPFQQGEHEQSIHSKCISLNQKIDRCRKVSYRYFLTETDVEVSSESEESSCETTPSHTTRKFYTQSGMSALFSPLIAYKEAFCSNTMVEVFISQYAYFELKNIQNVFNENFYKEVSFNECPQVIFMDNNPCLTTASSLPKQCDFINRIQKTHNHQPVMLIVDTTSATQAQIDEIKKIWRKGNGNIDILCFAKSALKNDQLGLDMAHYGCISIHFSKQLNAEHQLLFQNTLHQLTQGTSSVYSTLMRRDMRSTVHGVILKKKEKTPEPVKLATANATLFADKSNRVNTVSEVPRLKKN